MEQVTPDETLLQNSTRRLSAIMFTDMVGYTAMVQEDERQAREHRDRHRALLNDAVTRFGGKILQYYGDGTLSTFASAVSGVRCAIWIQQMVREKPSAPLRIGLHLGDIIEEENAVFGDGVNIASRIQAISIPGAVLISGKVYDEIKNHHDLPALRLGEFALKNVKRPLEIYAVNAVGLRTPGPHDLDGAKADTRSSIAVLPFVNMSNDAENEYFSDGIAEEVINALTKVGGLRVTARTSSFMFKGKNNDVREIGKQLNVTKVLEGSVRKAGDRVRITAQLINTDDGFHEWSEVFDRRLEDVFAVQDEISGAITRKLRLSIEGAGRVPPHVKTNMDAYGLYLKALHHWNKWTPSHSRKALQLLEEAVKIDPGFALAYAWQAFCYTYLGATGQISAKKAFPVARSLTEKAFELQGAIAESHLASGLIALFYDWNWDQAGKSIRKALEISPGWAVGHHLHAMYLSVIGHPDEAIAEMELAHSLDPISSIMNFALGETYFFGRRFHDALNQFQQTLAVEPDFRAAKNGLGYVLAEMGEYEKAINILEKAREDCGDDLKGWTELGFVYAKSGRRKEAEECIQRILLRQEREPDADLSMDIAIVHKGLGNLDEVFRYLNEAVDRRSGGIVFVKWHPGWESLRGDPRFAVLLQRIGM